VARLRGTGAHLSTSQLRAWTSLIDTGRILDAELEAELVQNHGMTHREYEVLVRLDGAGGAQRMSSLARQIEASAPLVTQTVARLEERGWIARQPSSTDGRGVDAVLTKAGEAALVTAAEPHAALIRSLFLTPLGDEVELVASGLGAIADHLRAHRAGVGCDDPACPMGQD
jgi:DNA-binding MarR family transcriptional regulator